MAAKELTAKEIISQLERKHKGDQEAIEEIERAKETIEYYERQGEEEKAMSHARQLDAFLHDWY